MAASGAAFANLEIMIDEDRHRIRHACLLIVSEYKSWLHVMEDI